MKKMKRVLVALLSCLTAFACLAGTVACGDDKKPTTDNNNSQSESSVDSSSKEESSSSDEVTEPEKDYCAENGHFLVELEEIKATCTTNGRAATFGCANCDWYHNPAPVLKDRADYATADEYEEACEAYFTYWAEYSALGKHVWSEEATEKVAPTCCEEGVKAYYTCANCDALSLNGLYEMTEEETTVIPATGNHTYVSYVVPKEPTCTEAGWTVGWECAEGGVVVSQPLDALDHDEVYDKEADNYIGSTAATCTANAFCGRCGELKDTKVAHSLKAVEAKAVTCAEDGWAAYEVCENCTYSTFAGILDNVNDHWKVQKADKNYTTVDKKMSSCTEYGWNRHFVCGDCGFVRDTDAATESVKAYAVLDEDAKNIYDAIDDHKFNKTANGDYKRQVNPTCLTEGKEESGTCTQCNQYIDGKVIPATGHSFEGENAKITANSYPADCTRDAKCSNTNCDGDFKDTKLGHDWKAVEKVYAICGGEAGVEAHFECANEGCTACAYEDAEKGEMVVKSHTYFNYTLSHSLKTVEAKAATCYAIGWNQYQYCEHCSYTTYQERPITNDHGFVNKAICSEWLVCETFATADNNGDGDINADDIYDVNEDGKVDENDNLHIGCGRIFPNAEDNADHRWNEDDICEVCSECNHSYDIKGVCENCGKCSHKFYSNNKCVVCDEECVDHKWVLVSGNAECENCDAVCDHTNGVAHGQDGKCSVCKLVAEDHDWTKLDGKCVECGLHCDHTITPSNKTCDICNYTCDHKIVFGKGTCACGDKTCDHPKHDEAEKCVDCGLEKKHTFVYNVIKEVLECACGVSKDVCKHELHEQSLEIVCSNPNCDGNYPLPEHTFDMTVVTSTNMVKCTNENCRLSVAYSFACKHENHDANLQCTDEKCKLTYAEQQEKSMNVAKHVYDAQGFCSCDVKITADENLILIKNATELKAFADKVNAGESYSGKTVMLLADIDLEGAEWDAIGTKTAPFSGTFNGYNKTISNFTVIGSDCVGFFGKLLNGTVKDLTIANATFEGKHYVGAIAGYAYGNIVNCKVNDVKISCIDENEVDGDKAGAIVGYVGESAKYEIKNNRVENVEIVANRDAGAIIGCTANGCIAVIEGNVFADVTITHSGYGTGANLKLEVVGRKA